MSSIIKNKRNLIIKIILLFLLLNTKLFSYAYDQITLDNGLNVHLIKTDDIMVTHAIVYNVGFVNQSVNKSGVASLLEQMMNFGTNRYSKQQLQDIYRDISGEYNSCVLDDISLYYSNIPEEFLEEVIKIEVDRMRWLSIDENNLPEAIHNITKFNNNIKNNIYTYFENVLQRYTFPTTSYGLEQSSKNITIQDIRDFYELWYVPNNAHVFIIGDINIELTKKLVNKHYNKVSVSRNFKNDTKYIEDPYKGNISFDFVSNKVDQTVVVKSYLVPTLFSNDSFNKHEAYSLLVLQEILLAKDNTLYKELVEEKNILSDFYVEYDDSKQGLSVFSFYLFPNKGIDKDIALQELEMALREAINKGFSIIDLRLSVTKIRDKLDLLQDDYNEHMLTILKYLTAGLTFYEFTRRANIASTISSQDIVDVYNKYIKESNYIVGIASSNE